MNIFQTKLFGKHKKKLHANQIKALDEGIKQIIVNPNIGDPKIGDLHGISVYKFKMLKQEYLLAYAVQNEQLDLLAIGKHENLS